MSGAELRWDAWTGESATVTERAGVLIAVVEPDDAVRFRLFAALGDPVLALTDLASVRDHLGGAPTVVVLGPGCATAGELDDVGRLLGEHPEVAAVLVSATMTPDVFRHALRIGVRDVVPSLAEVDVLRESVARIAAELLSGTPNDPPVSAGPVAPSGLGRVITVFSTKGGAGKSVVATNLAVVLARRSEQPVVLVDADLQFGDVTIMTRLTPQQTFVDAVDSGERLDADLLRRMLMVHEPSGLLVLSAPLEPKYADRISAAEVLAIVDLLRTFAGHVVIDTPATFNDVVLGVIEKSDDVVVVAGMDVPSIKNVKIGLQTLRLLDIADSKFHLVLNRIDAKAPLDVAEVERTLKLSAVGQIPADVAVTKSVNRGTPVVLDAPRSAVAKAIEAVAERFVDAAVAVADAGPRRRRPGRKGN